MLLYRKAIELADRGKRFALAQVIKASGSTPQKAGAGASVEPDGPVWGTLGGGCLEAESRVRALRALDDGRPAVFDLSLDEDYGWDDGLICGGRVRVLVDPHAGRHCAVYAEALEAWTRRNRGVLVTTLTLDADAVETRVVWVPEGELEGCPAFPGAEALRGCLENEKAAHHVEEGLEAFLEPVVPAPRLVIAGGGHVGQAVARLGHFLEFDVTVIDDRPAFTRPERYPEGVTTLCGDIARIVGEFPAGPDTYFVIVTRGHRHDGEVLERCIRRPAAYIGMIGSKRKILLIRRRFLERGLATEAELDRVHSPMGLDIGSVTVPEIATSIAAELVAVRRNRRGAGRHLREAVPT